MKYLIIVLLFVSSLCFSQGNNLKSQKVSFNVKGVCEMCKDRIEKGTLKLKGVKYVKWDIISNNISLIYNSKKIKLDDIHKEISLLVIALINILHQLKSIITFQIAVYTKLYQYIKIK